MCSPCWSVQKERREACSLPSSRVPCCAGRQPAAGSSVRCRGQSAQSACGRRCRAGSACPPGHSASSSLGEVCNHPFNLSHKHCHSWSATTHPTCHTNTAIHGLQPPIQLVTHSTCHTNTAFCWYNGVHILLTLIRTPSDATLT